MIYFTFFPSSFYFGYVVKLDLANTVAEFNTVFRFLYYPSHIQSNVRMSEVFVRWLTYEITEQLIHQITDTKSLNK